MKRHFPQGRGQKVGELTFERSGSLSMLSQTSGQNYGSPDEVKLPPKESIIVNYT